MTAFKSLPNHFGDVILDSCVSTTKFSFGKEIPHLNPFEYKLRYFNLTTENIVVGLRNGIKFTVPPDGNPTYAKFIVRVEFMIHTDEIQKEIWYQVQKFGDHSPLVQRLIKEAFTPDTLYPGTNYRRMAPTSRLHRSFMLDFEVSPDEIRKKGGSIYLQEADLMLSLNNVDDAPFHPYSEQGMLNHFQQNSVFEKSTKNSFDFSIECIDNASVFGIRYINICNRVFRIIPKKDPEKKDGLYILHSSAVMGEYGEDGIEIEYYTFSRAKSELLMYTSYELAFSNGDLNLARKEELSKLEHQIAMLKSLNQAEKAKHELELQEKDRLIKELALEKEKLAHESEMERQKTKDYYDSRASGRKDVSDFLKYMPAMIVAVAGILTLVKTIFFP